MLNSLVHVDWCQSWENPATATATVTVMVMVMLTVHMVVLLLVGESDEAENRSIPDRSGNVGSMTRLPWTFGPKKGQERDRHRNRGWGFSWGLDSATNRL